MKFGLGGPDVPVELIRAQERGECVFVCGAGVSRTIGLPSFDELTEAIYAALHEHWEAHPAEREAMDQRRGRALDRALFALQLRLSGTDKRRGAEVRRRIVDAVQRALPIPRRKLSAHLDILRLSRDAEMRPCVVTTNFDTLFERAWRRSRATTLASYAVAAMPPPGSAEFSGIQHLHGRIEDRGLQLPRSDLILNSADFGEAYLRSGWAARYVYDLARTAVIVIVGYGVDDPPVRYMLEVLTADRSRYTDLRDIYAFVPCRIDPAARETERARWQARGVTPILYDCNDPADHSALYATVQAWAGYAEDPATWQRATAAALFARSPDQLEAHEWDQLTWTLQRGDGPKILADANPEAGWASHLQARKLIGVPQTSVGRWVTKRLADRHMIDAALQHLTFDDEAIWRLENALEDPSDLPRHYHQAWSLIFDNLNRRRRPGGMDWHLLMRRIRHGQIDVPIQRQIARSLRPQLSVGRALRWPGMPEPSGNGLHDLIRLDFITRQPWQELLKAWPRGEELSLLRRLDLALAEALEDAREYGFLEDWRDRTSDDVRSVSRHAQDHHHDGFYPIIRVMADLLERLVESDRAAARALAQQWTQAREALPQRLHLHALSLAAAFTADEAAAWLRSSDDERFWGLDYRREVMRLLAERWPEFSAEDRLALERRIADEMPLSLFREEVRASPEIPAIVDHETFTRLSRLAVTPPGLSEFGARKLAHIAEAHPHWVASGERDDFSSWSTERIGEQGDPELLANIPHERLVQQAAAVAESDPMNQGEIWRRFCQVEPQRAFAGLRATAARDETAGHAWTPYFWALDDLEEPDLQRQTLDFLLASPDLDLGPFAHAVVNWLERKREALRSLCGDDPEPLLALWDRLATALFGRIDADEHELPFDDPITAVLNRGEGKLARVLVSELSDRQRQRGEGIAADLVDRFTLLAVETSNKGFVGRAALTWDLTFLHALDPEWTRTYLEPLLDWSHPEAAGHWAAYSHAHTLMDVDQFARLKANFLEAFRRPAGDSAVEGLTTRLVQMVRQRHFPLTDRYDLEPEEARQALRWSEEARRTASFILFKRLEQVSPEVAANLWRSDVGPTFIDLWPMEPQLGREDSTLYLSWMAQRCGSAFPEAVDTVAPALLATSRAAHGLIMHLDDEKGEVLRRFPDAALKLIDLLVDRQSPPEDLTEALETLAAAKPAVRRHPTYNQLLGIARRNAS